MTIAFYSIFVACLLPYVAFSFVAKDLDIQNPRVSARNLVDGKARAYGAHLNNFETLPFFIAAVLINHILLQANSTVDMLAVAYVIVRLGFTFSYIKGLCPMRSIIFGIGLLINIVLFLFPVFN